MASAYIPDGYTEKAFIKGVPGLYQAVRFEYRPLLPDAVRAKTHSWNLISATEASKRINETIHKQVVSWDLEHDDKALPVESKVVCRLKFNLLDRMFNIITQFDVGDEDPNAEIPQQEEDSKN